MELMSKWWEMIWSDRGTAELFTVVYYVRKAKYWTKNSNLADNHDLIVRMRVDGVVLGLRRLSFGPHCYEA